MIASIMGLTQPLSRLTFLVVSVARISGRDIRRALDELYASATFTKLNDPECGLYYQGAVYIFQYLKSEIETGRIAQQEAVYWIY